MAQLLITKNHCYKEKIISIEDRPIIVDGWGRVLDREHDVNTGTYRISNKNRHYPILYVTEPHQYLLLMANIFI